MTEYPTSADDQPTGSLGVGAGALAPEPGGGPPRLVVLMGDQRGRRYRLDGETFVLGRAEGCEIQLDDTRISRKHARVFRDGENWSIEDLESRNGTVVGGEEISGPTRLSLGDRIQLSGQTLLLFTRQDPMEDLLLHRQQMEVIGHLAAGIAHDFNNLLNVIATSAAHLDALPRDTTLDHRSVRECLADIDAASQRAAELTGRLLKIARHRERPQPDEQTADVTAITEDALKLLRRTFDRSIEIDAEVGEGLAVRGDRAAVNQLLMNLCINARDAMPDGGTLRLTVAGEAAEGDAKAQVLLVVADTGVGMDETTRERIFEPFFTTKRKGAGSGLGLATAYEVVTNLGGTIEVKSAPGEGSTFLVRLPAAGPSDAGAGRRRRRRMSTWDNRQAPKETGHVLVVDDQELVRKSIGRLLEAFGNEVSYAVDGRDALAKIVEHDGYDVIVMDLDMPNLGGRETLARVREHDPDARVLMISGYYDESLAQELVSEGALDFLAKPLDARALADAVRAALGAPL